MVMLGQHTDDAPNPEATRGGVRWRERAGVPEAGATGAVPAVVSQRSSNPNVGCKGGGEDLAGGPM